jgi:hypothetical protein
MHIGAKYILGSWVLIEGCWFTSIYSDSALHLKDALFRLDAHTATYVSTN